MASWTWTRACVCTCVGWWAVLPSSGSGGSWWDRLIGWDPLRQTDGLLPDRPALSPEHHFPQCTCPHHQGCSSRVCVCVLSTSQQLKLVGAQDPRTPLVGLVLLTQEPVICHPGSVWLEARPARPGPASWVQLGHHICNSSLTCCFDPHTCWPGHVDRQAAGHLTLTQNCPTFT